MPPPFDSISKIHPPREAWRLKVRVLRTWIVPSFGNHDVANSMEILLVDKDSNKIQAIVKKQLINKFKENIIESQTYRMSYFSVVPNQGNYRAAEHEFKLVFLNHTTVIPVPNNAIPKTCFSFYVIGLLTFVGEEKEYVKDGKVMKIIILELSSKELTIRCALFGECVDEVYRFLGSDYMEQPVVVIQLAKVKFFRDIGLQNVMHATRLFFNPDLAEVFDFKNSMVDQDINGTQPLFIANEDKGVSLEYDFMRLTKRCTIEELHDNNEEGSFVILGTVRSIVDEGPWWYSACVCEKSIQPQGGAYYCDFCQHYVTNVTPKYRIKIAIEDDNGHGVFVLFDHTKSVGADKYFETFRVRRVCDDAAIIAMFELPNYNADDEHTKDGYLEKIPSSDHGYIVGKKDPCEVLDEGITSDGNCSNIKTNCRPLIDFLGEKGAEIPRLDDISSEVDIIKEKGKIVDDSVLVDRKCSLEIEVLLNSPPRKTTDVLSAVLDGSHVHVIKKETVYNPPRGGKVKRNLKKAFDDVADEELGPTSKVLKNCDL
ncbi:Replication protein A 70 kDa DNA-binding subunit C [Arachis hypogaea]|nr:Replication protein A 70 kDa DNA-binding subunit C [Arachis hypogaea]